jgi:hypothetical protein
MTDIVERLRTHHGEPVRLMQEAAVEIEDLRKRLAGLEAMLVEQHDELERLREVGRKAIVEKHDAVVVERAAILEIIGHEGESAKRRAKTTACFAGRYHRAYSDALSDIADAINERGTQ